MTDEGPSPRRYSEKEVALILRRATEIQRTEPSAGDRGGLTLAELEEIAAEAGIDLQHLRTAAAEVERGGAKPESLLQEVFAGGPFTIRLERRFPGELPEAAFDELVPLIERATEGHGQASSVGKTLTWSSATAGNTSSQQVLVRSREGETLISLEDRLGGLAGALFGGIVGGGSGVGIGVGGALGGALGSAFLGFVIPAGVIGSSYMIARAIFTAQVRRRRGKLHELMEEIAARMERTVHQRTLEPPEEPTTRGRSLGPGDGT